MFRKIQLSCFCNWPWSCHMKCQTIDISRDKPLHCLVNKLSFGISFKVFASNLTEDLWSNFTGHKNPAFYANFVITFRKKKNWDKSGFSE